MASFNLTGITIYPLKSMRGIALKTAEAGIRGFQHDRRFLLVDDDGRYMTQRIYPQMATFDVNLSESGFSVSRNGTSIDVPFDLLPSGSKMIDILDDRLMARLAPPYFGKWFSSQLGMDCHLVFMDASVQRAVPEKYRINNEEVSFADAFPYLIIGEMSLHALNSRLKLPLPMNRFRPNLVFSGGEPFSEDNFDHFRIGDALFKAVKPCIRCVVTTTDQLTGHREKEPLSTLATFRNIDNKILFGQNLICLQPGRVRVGDPLIPVS